MKYALLALLVGATSAHAESVGDVVRAKLLPSLPDGTDIATVHLPRSMVELDVEADEVTVELPRNLTVGRPSVKVGIRGKRSVFVPVTIGPVVEVAVATRALVEGSSISASDMSIEMRAVDVSGGTDSGRRKLRVTARDQAPAASLLGATVRTDIAAGSIIRSDDVVLSPPLPRGTAVNVEIRRGAVRVRGAGTLELSARPGDAATVRLSHTRSIVRGTLVSSSTVVVGETP